MTGHRGGSRCGAFGPSRARSQSHRVPLGPTKGVPAASTFLGLAQQDVPFPYRFRNDCARLGFDSAKSASNQAKHGIDFTDTQALRGEENCLKIQARTEDEPCWLLIRKIRDRTWAANVARRRGVIRIISVRRARASQEALYEGS